MATSRPVPGDAASHASRCSRFGPQVWSVSRRATQAPGAKSRKRLSEERARETARFYSDNPDKARERLEQQARDRSADASIPAGETFAQYLDRWLQNRKDRGYTSVESDRSGIKLHVVPHIGSKPIATITCEDLERPVHLLDEKVARK
jgi:hypothetical protein